MLKTTSDPIVEAFKGTWVADLLRPFPTGNQIGFDLSVGLLVSVFFYLLVVALPARAKRSRIKRHLSRQYDYFRRDCLLQLLWASGDGVAYSEVGRLLDRDAFKAHFKAVAGGGMDRWNVVENALQSEAWRLAKLVEQLEVFRAELEFALSVVEVDDPEALEVGRRLYQVLQHGTKWQAEYDDIKQVSGFFWSVFTGWDIAAGYTNRDHIEDFIRRL